MRYVILVGVILMAVDRMGSNVLPTFVFYFLTHYFFVNMAYGRYNVFIVIAFCTN